MIRRLAWVLCGLLVPAVAAAQSVTADRVYLGATGCVMRTGAGAPTGGASCDFYLDTATGHVWQQVAGTWINVSTTVAVTRGGTGQTSLTAGGVVYGNGTGAVGVTAAPVANSLLGVSGGVPAFSSAPTVASLTATTRLTTPEVAAAGSLALRPTGAVVLDPGSRTVVPGSNFGVSLGAPEQKFLALHLGELWAETLVAQDVLATVGGRVMVAPTTLLTTDLAPGATSITVKHNNLQTGDRVFLQAAPGGVPQIEWLAVTSAASGSSGGYVYTVTRNLDGSGANQWYAGDAVLNTGTAGKGFIDLYALSGVLTGYGPTIVGNVRTGTGYNQVAPRWALGNLRDVGYGHTGSDIYGAAFGNPAGAYLYADPTNGIVLGGPSGPRVTLTPAGAATFVGDGGGVTNIDGGNIRADSITASQIAANAITASELAANAVTADKIAAGSVTTAKLVVGDTGAALNDDPNIRDITAWSYTNAAIASEPGYPPVGPYSWRSSSTSTYGFVTQARTIPVDRTRTYRIHGRMMGYGTGLYYLGVAVWDANNTYQNVIFWCANGVAGTGTWMPPFDCLFGAGTGRDFPGNAFFMGVATLLNYPSGTGYYETQDLRIEEVLPSTLIQDGAITTDKLTANAVTAGKIAAGAVTAASIAAGSITGDRIAASTITSGNIAASTITGDKIAARTITTNNIGAGSVTANEIAASSITGDRIAARTITTGNIGAGSITANEIAARSISADRIASRAITTNEIAAGSITANEIAGGSITADKLNVGTLSAISANLGTVTAGTVNGVTINGTTINGSTFNGGGGQVVLDDGGMRLGNGDGVTQARIKFAGGAVELWGNSAGTVSTNGAMDISGRLHGFGALTVDGEASIKSRLYVDNGNDVWFTGNNSSVHWNGSMPYGTSGGPVYFDGGCRCLVSSYSTQRFKDNIRPWAPANPLAILSLPLYRYDTRHDPPAFWGAKDHVGLLVEELYKIAPEAVVLDDAKQPLTIQQDTFEVYLLAAIRAVNDRVAKAEALEARIAELERRLAIAEARGGGK